MDHLAGENSGLAQTLHYVHVPICPPETDWKNWISEDGISSAFSQTAQGDTFISNQCTSNRNLNFKETTDVQPRDSLPEQILVSACMTIHLC